MAMWIALSGSVILINKWILDPQLGGFPYPLALSGTHMAFCSVLSSAIVRAGLVEAPPLPLHVYLRCDSWLRSARCASGGWAGYPLVASSPWWDAAELCLLAALLPSRSRHAGPSSPSAACLRYPCGRATRPTCS